MPIRLFRSARHERNRFVALYVVLVSGLMLAAAIFVFEARVILQDDVSAERAFTVLGVAARAFDDLQDAETGQRGYLLTGSPDYLRPYDRGVGDIDDAMRQLQRILDDDQSAMAILRRIERVRRNKIAELAATIDLSRGGDWRQAIALVKTDEGERDMDTLRGDFAALRVLLDARRTEAANDARARLMFGTGALAVVAVFVGGLLAYALVVQQRAFAHISAYSEAMDREAGCDPLTGLPNRRKLLATLDALASQSNTGASKVAVLYMDVDGFKHVNDVLGHSAGDAFLGRLAKRLASAMRRDDVLARVGGDEFVALLDDYRDDDDLRQLALRLIEQAQAVGRASYAGRFEIGLSIGIATYPDRVKDIRQLIDVADAAMYAAKRERSSTFRFGPTTANDGMYEVRMRK